MNEWLVLKLKIGEEYYDEQREEYLILVKKLF